MVAWFWKCWKFKMANSIWRMLKNHKISNVLFGLEISHSGVSRVAYHESDLRFCNFWKLKMADPLWRMIKYHKISNVFFWLEVSHSRVFRVGDHESDFRFCKFWKLKMADLIWRMIKYHKISNTIFWLEISHSGVSGVGDNETELRFCNFWNNLFLWARSNQPFWISKIWIKIRNHLSQKLLNIHFIDQFWLKNVNIGLPYWIRHSRFLEFPKSDFKSIISDHKNLREINFKQN